MKIKSILTPLFCCAILAAALITATTTAGAASSKKKIVALTPFSASTLINVGKKPVAIGAMAVESSREKKLKGIRQLALSHPNGPNMEEIAEIDPDVVLSSSGWAKGTQTMRDLAITVRLMDPSTPDKVIPQIRAIGSAYGSKKLTDKFVNQTKSEIGCGVGTVKCGKPKKKHPIPGQKKKVLIVLGVGRTPYVFLRNSWGGSIVSKAGGEVLDGKKTDSGGFARVADEWIVAQNPEVIIGVPHGNAKDLDGIADYMRSNPAWSTTPAVKNGQVYISENDSLLQPNTDVGDTIKKVREKFLKNWN